MYNTQSYSNLMFLSIGALCENAVMHIASLTCSAV